MALLRSRGLPCGALVLVMAWLATATLAAGRPALTLVRGDEILGLALEDLAAMPQRQITTETEFTDGPVTFSGPLARVVLRRLGLDEVEAVRFVAANDYFVDVPLSDLQRYDVILAMQADGVPLSRRDKGPLWLMYPISDHPELSEPIYNARLIWQVIRIEAQ